MNLSALQRACSAARELDSVGCFHGGDRKGSTQNLVTIKAMTQKHSVSNGYIKQAKKLLKTNPDLFKLVEDGLHFTWSEQDQPLIYVFHMIGTDYYKIGKSTRSVQGRLASCQTGNPYKLEVVLTYPSDDLDNLELALHDQFGKYRMEGEWFELGAEDLISLVNQLEDS